MWSPEDLHGKQNLSELPQGLLCLCPLRSGCTQPGGEYTQDHCALAGPVITLKTTHAHNRALKHLDYLLF